MKIAIVGPGAVGCLFAALLSKAGQEVILIDHDQQRAEFISENGLHIEGIGGSYKITVPAAASPEAVAQAEVILICVKSYHTVEATERLKPYLSDNCRILTLQNGVGNVEALSEIFGAEKVWGGVTAQGATYLGLGNVRHAGNGQTTIGAVIGPGQEKELEGFASLLTNAGIKANVAENVQNLVWSKLIINVGINALTAITALKNGQLLEFAGTEKLMELAVDEAEKVAAALKIEIIHEVPINQVKAVAEATAANVSSMLQDVLAKRRTEIDHINGAIVSIGKNHGIPTPVNLSLALLVKTIESSYGQTV